MKIRGRIVALAATVLLGGGIMAAPAALAASPPAAATHVSTSTNTGLPTDRISVCADVFGVNFNCLSV